MSEPRFVAGKDPAPSIAELMHGSLALTPATVALVGANVFVFAAMLAYGAGLWHSPNDVQLAWGAGFGPATKDGDPFAEGLRLNDEERIREALEMARRASYVARGVEPPPAPAHRSGAQ